MQGAATARRSPAALRCCSGSSGATKEAPTTESPTNAAVLNILAYFRARCTKNAKKVVGATRLGGSPGRYSKRCTQSASIPPSEPIRRLGQTACLVLRRALRRWRLTRHGGGQRPHLELAKARPKPPDNSSLQHLMGPSSLDEVRLCSPSSPSSSSSPSLLSGTKEHPCTACVLRLSLPRRGFGLGFGESNKTGKMRKRQAILG